MLIRGKGKGERGKKEGSGVSGLDGFDEVVEHAGEFFGFGDPFFALFRIYVADIHADVNLGSEFAGRAFGIIYKV